ncbi:pseudouridylate synthase RPUSD4, mitochondrial [Columba livia]|uniref:pseudouridylate synthase RPUSD4, mitochondrial n=1 Tax=Columba livia TaxID=8932 RepID=UPI0031BAA3B8
MAVASGSLRRCWRPAAAFHRAAHTGRAEPLRAEDLAERLRARKSEEEKRETPPDPARRRLRELAALGERLQRVHPNVLAKALRRGTVYQDEEIVVINKPYGLPVHGGPGVKNSIADVLPILSKMLENMKAQPLHLCHRLDKETTGLMVLARSEEAAEQIRLLFKTRQVEKVYWAISVGVPDPTEGIVEIPIVEKQVQSHQPHYKMTLAPNYCLAPEDGKVLKIRKKRDAESAVTRFRVLGSSSACSLLELQPITGVKHQIRVHLAYGLGCPVLGDHKYSHWSKLAPQKLPEITLRRLKLAQSKARHVPLHLHALRLSLPLRQRVELFCKPPPFFQNTLNKLQLDIANE